MTSDAFVDLCWCALTPDIWEYLAEKGGLPTTGIFDIEYTDSGQSRAGDGMKTAGDGTASKKGGSDKAVSNSEGGGVTKRLYTERDSDRIIDVDTGECINESDLDSNGNYKQ